jgi:hypothetical protein
MGMMTQRWVMMTGLHCRSVAAEVRLTGLPRLRGRYVVPWDTKTVMVGRSVKVVGRNTRTPIVPPITRRH